MKACYFVWIGCLILFLVGCGQEELPASHVQYLHENGWTITDMTEQSTYTLQVPEEMILNFEANKLTFMRTYNNETVTHYVYTLKEKDEEGAHLQAILFEHGDEVIGGYGVMPSYTPGVFHLEDQQRLLDEQRITR